jgi:hypothetical protein
VRSTEFVQINARHSLWDRSRSRPGR